MANDPREELLGHYQRELGYLRRMGAAFAQAYPKVAGRLELSETEAADPHVERLIESVAFLAGRIQRNLDAEFPQIPQALLGILYPQFVNPVPSLSIAAFMPDPDRGELTQGYRIARGTALFAESPTGPAVRWRTAYDVDLWPISVTGARFETPDAYDALDARFDVEAVLKISLKTDGAGFSELGVERLRFFLNGDRVLTDTLYELLVVNCVGVALVPDRDKSRLTMLAGDALVPVGFEEDQAVLDHPLNGQPGYRLLQELFAFPEKFLFRDVAGLDRAGADESLDILILLSAPPRRRATIGKETFRLGCTPVVNLFTRLSEPIRIDGLKPEYKLVADRRRERITEIHSIQKVTAASRPDAAAEEVEPFFSFSHDAYKRDARAFWVARRDSAEKAGLLGTDVYLSFLDLDFEPTQPAETTLYAHLTCTNRGLAEELQAGAVLTLEEAGPVAGVSLLVKPTAQLNPPIRGETLWRLVSHLSLNHLSLSNEAGSLEALKEILRLYDLTGDPATARQISGLTGMTTRPAIRRLGIEAWRGFVRGTEVEIRVDERAYVGASAIVLASVLDRFLGMHGAANSFTQLTLTSQQREGVWTQWPARAGAHPLL